MWSFQVTQLCFQHRQVKTPRCLRRRGGNAVAQLRSHLFSILLWLRSRLWLWHGNPPKHQFVSIFFFFLWSGCTRTCSVLSVGIPTVAPLPQHSLSATNGRTTDRFGLEYIFTCKYTIYCWGKVVDFYFWQILFCPLLLHVSRVDSEISLNKLLNKKKETFFHTLFNFNRKEYKNCNL